MAKVKKKSQHEVTKDSFREVCDTLLAAGIERDAVLPLVHQIVGCFNQGTGLVWSEAAAILDEQHALRGV